MNRKTLILGSTLVVVIVIGLAAYQYLDREATIKDVQRAYLDRGSVTCSFTNPHTEQPGELYIKDGQVKIITEDIIFPDKNSTVNSDQGSTKEITVIKNEQVHIWQIGQTEGLKVSLEQLEDNWLLSQAENLESLTAEAGKHNLVCRKTRLSGNLFSLPDEVKFSTGRGVRDEQEAEEVRKTKQMMLEVMRQRPGQEDATMEDVERIIEEWYAKIFNDIELKR